MQADDQSFHLRREKAAAPFTKGKIMKALNITNNYASFPVVDEQALIDSLLMKLQNPILEADFMEEELGGDNNYTSFNIVLTDEQDPKNCVSTALNDLLKEDLLSRLPDLPRATQLSLREMFSTDLWNSLTAEQRRTVATTIHFMATGVVHLMPTGRGIATEFSIHDYSSPMAQIAVEAVREWLRGDELHQEKQKRIMEGLLEARSRISDSPELDLLIKVMAMYN